MLNIHSIFQANNGLLELHLTPEIQTTINEYFQKEPSQEIGGLFLGTTQVRNDKTALQITGILLATTKHNKDFLNEFRFNHEIWRDLYAKKAELWPEATILGWFYGHPANHHQPTEDVLHIHKNFFPQPYQVACLLNAVTTQSWVYHWENDTLKPLQIVLSQVPIDHINQLRPKLNPTVDSDQPEVQPSKLNQLLNNMSTQMKAVVGGILIICLAIIGLYPILKPVQELPNQGNVVSSGQIPVHNDSTSTKEPINQPINKLSNEPPVDNIKSAPKETSSAKSSPKDSAEDNIEIYYVQKGDSLWSISAKYYGSGLKFYKILEQNDLDNLKTLHVGMKLEIPLAD